MKYIFPIVLSGLLLLSACTNSKGGGGVGSSPQPVSAVSVLKPESGGTANADGGAPVALTITGKITFDRLPATTGGLGATPSIETAANVVVEAVAYNDINNVLATANAIATRWSP